MDAEGGSNPHRTCQAPPDSQPLQPPSHDLDGRPGAAVWRGNDLRGGPRRGHLMPLLRTTPRVTSLPFLTASTHTHPQIAAEKKKKAEDKKKKKDLREKEKKVADAAKAAAKEAGAAVPAAVIDAPAAAEGPVV